MTAPHVFVIAGEASGDVLGGRAMAALRSQCPGIRFDGIGGPAMEAQGLQSRLPMEQLCVMGIWEIVVQIPRLLRLINDVVKMVEAAQPDVLLTIDVPDFNFRVSRALKKRGKFKGKIIHYVAPTVWAWRPGRAKKLAGVIDGLICLLPFEPPYFAAHGIAAIFAGHPLVEEDVNPEGGARFRREHDIASAAKTLGLLFGSRASEVASTGPVIAEGARILLDQDPDLQIIVPTLAHVRPAVEALLAAHKIKAIITDHPAMKHSAFMACDAALAVSGTVGLELACAGVPHAIAYRLHPISHAIIRRLVRVKYAHLANLLLDAPVIPEYLQDKAQGPALAEAAWYMLYNDDVRQDMRGRLASVRGMLRPGPEKTPSQEAAGFINTI